MILKKFFVFLMICSFSQLVKSVNPLEETRVLDPFNKVIAAQGINVKLVYNDLEEAFVKVKGASLDEVITEVKDMTLKVRLKASMRKDVTVMVEVSYKQLNSIEANTGAYIETRRPLWGEQVKLYSITGGIIKVESEVEQVNAITSGASLIEIYGKAKKINVIANLGADIKAFKLISDVVIAQSKSGSKIQVYATESINAKATLGATVEIKGKPLKKTVKTSLGGEIREVNDAPNYGIDLIRDEN